MNTNDLLNEYNIEKEEHLSDPLKEVSFPTFRNWRIAKESDSEATFVNIASASDCFDLLNDVDRDALYGTVTK